MKISKDFEEFFELLKSREVEYLIVGGYAYAIHAEPRYTKDLDIFYNPTEENARKLLGCLEEFGFGSMELSIGDFTGKGQILQLGVPPLRIDLINEIEGVLFSEAWTDKITAKYGKQTINVVSKSTLIRNKKAVGREQDLLDVKRLEKQ